MPASRSAKPSAERRPPPRSPARSKLIAPLLVIVVLAVLAVVVAALPASLVNRALAPGIVAADFSGTLWHGSAGRLASGTRDAGAIEWHLHPLALLSARLVADVHWVKGGFVADGSVAATRSELIATLVHGGGPLEDLQSLGLPGARGASTFDFTRIRLVLTNGAANVQSAVGDVTVADLVIPQIANGADLGDYRLHAADGAITPDADATAELTDTGGPLELRAVIHYSAKERTGQLSGTLKERADVPPALRNELNALTQLHARDAQGRIPVDLEFTL
jgi:hypothetical protein